MPTAAQARATRQKAEEYIAYHWGDKLEGFSYLPTHLLAWYVTEEGRDDAAIFNRREVQSMADHWEPKMARTVDEEGG